MATGNVRVISVSRPQQYPLKESEISLTDGDKNNLLSLINGLRPNPEVATELLGAVRESSFPALKSPKIISRDIVLAAHVFRMCNSAYYGHPGEISFLESAVGLLGERQVRRILVVAATMKHSDDPVLDFGELMR